jgi:hypothetical protein
MICPDPPDLEPLGRTLRYTLAGGALLLALQFSFPRSALRLSRLLWRAAGTCARRPALCGWLLLFAVLAVRAALLPRFPIPVPGVHDEFSYLLMGDTLAHFRLANPPHPMWVSFETFHVNWLPNYASMYPPGQGLVLAIGEWLGTPWIGVLLSCAAMCAAVYWMLLCWLPPRWALVGGVICWLKFAVVSYWMNSYWGGAVAATGGALLLGALGRLPKRPTARDALLLGLGAALLANTRPFEGFLFALPAAAYLLFFLARAADPKRVVLPLAAVLGLTALFMGYYNRRLTGHALLFPHTLNVRTYHTAPMFLFERSKPEIHYRNEQFEEFYNGWEREEYDHSFESVKCLAWLKTVRFFSAFAWWGLLLAAPGAYVALRDPRLRLPLLMLLAVAVGTYQVVWSNAHYAAPVTGLLVLLFVKSLRALRLMRWRNRRWGAVLARTALLLLVADTATALLRKQCDTFYWTCQGDVSRLVIARKLEALPGKHLVMVRYGEDHNIHDEWVYNGAEIDRAKVVWAREIDAEQDKKLFAYFRDRRIWLVTPDEDNTYLAPLAPPAREDVAR